MRSKLRSCGNLSLYVVRVMYREGRFALKFAGLRLGVMVRDFGRNIRILINKEVFSFKPIAVIEFRHSSNKGVN